ncbi:aldo/keto reductase [Lentzea sp. NPDC059081]|uniref:aldo/keto reductase n=1 Tax=Lentzea sp. NPDC059081 TaxID=3346719 RepID=UPI0036BEE217
MPAELQISLHNPRVGHVDLWLVHAWEQRVAVEETLSAIDTAVAAGEVLSAGLCNGTGPADGDVSAAHGIGVLPRAPLGRGCADREVPRRRAEGENHQRSLPVVDAALRHERGRGTHPSIARGSLTRARWRSRSPGCATGRASALRW